MNPQTIARVTGYYVFGALGALVFAALTGLAMLLMLRGRPR